MGLLLMGWQGPSTSNGAGHWGPGSEAVFLFPRLKGALGCQQPEVTEL